MEDVSADRDDDAAGGAAASAEGAGRQGQQLPAVGEQASGCDTPLSEDNLWEKILPGAANAPGPAGGAAATESPAAGSGTAAGAAAAAGDTASAQSAAQPLQAPASASGAIDALREAAAQAGAEAAQAEIDNDVLEELKKHSSTRIILQAGQPLKDSLREEAAVQVVYAIVEFFHAAVGTWRPGGGSARKARQRARSWTTYSASSTWSRAPRSAGTRA